MISKTTFKWTRTAHAWAGAVLSVLLFVLGSSGALLVFEDDYLRASMPAARADVAVTPEAFARIAEHVERSHGAEALRSIVFAHADLGVSQLRFRGEGRRAYLDGEGRIVAEWRGSQRFEAWLFDLHHRLLAGDFGETVAGLAGLAGGVLVVTGLIAWWPARRAFALRVWARSAQRRDLLAAHRNLGVLAAAPILIVALTGAGLVFSAQTKAIFSVFDADRRAVAAPSNLGEGDIDWRRAMIAAQSAFPEARLRIAIWPRTPGAPAVIRLQQPGEWHPNGRSYAYIDPANSSLVGVADAHAAPMSSRMFNAFYPVHAARLGEGALARLYDFSVFATGLALSVLGLFGLYSFLIKKQIVPPPRR